MENTAIDGAALAVDALKHCMSKVTMSQHKWTAEKRVPKVAAEVKSSKGASGRAVKVHVNLANGFEADISAVTRVMSRAYHSHIRMTIPWGSKDERMLSNLQLIDYMTEMQTHRTALDSAKVALLAVLPACITRAIQLNGQLGDAADYPSPQAIVDLFEYEWDFEPVADASGFAGLPDGFEERFSMNYETKVAERMADGIAETKTRLLKQLQAFGSTLISAKPRFFQGTVDNISQLGATLRGMNIAGDPDVEIVTTAVSDATQYSAEHLRDNMTIRTAVTATVSALLTALGSTPCANNTPAAPVVEVAEVPDASAFVMGEPEIPIIGTPEPVSVQDQFNEVFTLEEPAPVVETPPEAEPEVVEDDPNGIGDIIAGLF